jgi:hypothetical protein
MIAWAHENVTVVKNVYDKGRKSWALRIMRKEVAHDEYSCVYTPLEYRHDARYTKGYKYIRPPKKLKAIGHL